VCDGVPGHTGRAVYDGINGIPWPVPVTFARYVYPAGPPATDHPTDGTLALRYTDGEVVCRQAIPDAPENPNPGITPASVTIEVTVTFTTVDGLFADSFSAAASLRGDNLKFTGTAHVLDLKGDYRAIATGDSAGPTVDVEFFDQIPT